MLTMGKSMKISKNNNQKRINQKLTGFYLFYKELNYNSILKNIKQTTKITNRSISIFS